MSFLDGRNGSFWRSLNPRERELYLAGVSDGFTLNAVAVELAKRRDEVSSESVAAIQGMFGAVAKVLDGPLAEAANEIDRYYEDAACLPNEILMAVSAASYRMVGKGRPSHQSLNGWLDSIAETFAEPTTRSPRKPPPYIVPPRPVRPEVIQGETWAEYQARVLAYDNSIEEWIFSEARRKVREEVFEILAQENK